MVKKIVVIKKTTSLQLQESCCRWSEDHDKLKMILDKIRLMMRETNEEKKNKKVVLVHYMEIKSRYLLAGRLNDKRSALFYAKLHFLYL